MRKKIIIALITTFAAFAPASMSAQGLGGLLNKAQKDVKKGKDVLEKVTGNENSIQMANQGDDSQKNVKSISLDNGIEIMNPMADWIEVEPVGLYGVSKSENYGDAYLVLKVLMKEPKQFICIGGVNNQKMIAADYNGKVYPVTNGCMNYDTPEGIPVIVKMQDPQVMIQDIKKNIDKMQVLKFGIFIDANHKGNLTLKNVPIYWDVEPEF